MSLASLTEYIGRKGFIRTKTEGFTIPVTVLDVRERFGWVDYYIRPDIPAIAHYARDDGTWVQGDRVTLEEGQSND